MLRWFVSSVVFLLVFSVSITFDFGKRAPVINQPVSASQDFHRPEDENTEK